ncbi:50S ribosomal protein L5 [Myxococcota bacterium]|nr:50S ribosomal protein L5 [Myxococcota bacterium]MBU1382620.1 50S ribosomal protein L5 [Myxococcota bacterium]MBU1495837.1 50S ribosomal protein L5 [Myxococcota bacterium]
MAKEKGQPRGDAGKGKKGKEKFQNETIKREKLPRLQVRYNETIAKKMKEEFNYSNVMEIPRLTKIVINVGLGEAIHNPKLLEAAVEELKIITGRRPVVTRAKNSIANFKLREGMKIGAMVTLRREVMFEFLDRFVALALPRTRDFKGVSAKGFDGRGNCTLGIKEQIIFPEISYDTIEKLSGLNITMVTTAKTDDEARALLKHFGVPFRN